MRPFAFGAVSLLASCVSARSILSSAASSITTFEDGPKVPGENPLVFCASNDDDILKLEKVDLSPNPPLAGKNLTIVGTGKVAEDIEDGATVHVTVKFGVITLLRLNRDFCELIEGVDLECPLKKDKLLTLEKLVTLPKEIPPGTFHVQAEVNTKDGKQITCLKASVKFERHDPELFQQW